MKSACTEMKQGKTVQVGVRFTPDQRAQLEARAEREETSISEVVRQIVVPVIRGKARLFYDNQAA